MSILYCVYGQTMNDSCKCMYQKEQFSPMEGKPKSLALRQTSGIDFESQSWMLMQFHTISSLMIKTCAIFIKSQVMVFGEGQFRVQNQVCGNSQEHLAPTSHSMQQYQWRSPESFTEEMS